MGTGGAALLGLFGCANLTNRSTDLSPSVATADGAAPPLMDFTPVTLKQAATEQGRRWPLIAEEYDFDLILPFGDPIDPGGPNFGWPPSSSNQAIQLGPGHDGMWFFPDPEQPNSRGTIAVNHEFGANVLVLGKSEPESLDDVLASQHSHGVSVVNVERVNGKWVSIGGENVRRVHVNSTVTFSGPAAAHKLLRSNNESRPRGTLNNCASGHTPWGTYLTCEENWPFYFGVNREGFEATDEQKAYNLTGAGYYGWQKFDPRFDLESSEFANESNRFGWVVEIDPSDSSQVPVKHTALGRMGHEGAEVAIGKDDRVVVYMGDDAQNQHIYKFVSKLSYQAAQQEGKSPLEEGILYTARFNDDFTGEWIALDMKNSVLAERFSSQGEILVFTRIAARLVGATPMDRPEWITTQPNQDVYCTLTNNSSRTSPNAANPSAPNYHGHIIRWRENEDYTATEFNWDIFKIAADSQNTEELWGSPDGLWVDPDGRLFVETDGAQSDESTEINNQLLVMDTNSGEIRRLFTGVKGCEMTGITVTPDRKTMFVNVQHPGLDNYPGSNPGQVFPNLGPFTSVPRDCTVVITRKDGGIVGT